MLRRMYSIYCLYFGWEANFNLTYHGMCFYKNMQGRAENFTGLNGGANVNMGFMQGCYYSHGTHLVH